MITNSIRTVQMNKYNLLTICTVRIEFVSVENSVSKFVIRDAAPF